MDTGLDGHGVLVTGGAGGIGTSIVRAFAGEGARVAVHYRSSEALAVELAAEVGGIAVGADLTNESEADALVPAAHAGLGRLDVVVANAGYWPPESVPIWNLPLDRFESIVKTNLTTAFLTVRGFFRHVKSTGSGSLVLVGSTAGVYGEAGHADYAAAKGGIITGLLLSAKNEAAQIGPRVRVNAVSPGWTVTAAREDQGIDSEHFARATSTMALKKLGRPEDVASQIVVLASEKLSGHVTGQVVVVAGGMEGRLVG